MTKNTDTPLFTFTLVLLNLLNSQTETILQPFFSFAVHTFLQTILVYKITPKKKFV